MRQFVIALLAVAALHAQVTVTATRISQQPILSPGQNWASSGRFNPAAIRVGPKTVLLFRARDAAGAVASGPDPLDLIGYYGAADTYIGALNLRITLR